MKVFMTIKLEFELKPGKQVVEAVLDIVYIAAEVDMEFHGLSFFQMAAGPQGSALIVPPYTGISRCRDIYLAVDKRTVG